jgi:hypothetical protein
MFGAWQAERFAREKRLKPLAKYLPELRPRHGQMPSEMLAALRALQSAGAPMTITRVDRPAE